MSNTNLPPDNEPRPYRIPLRTSKNTFKWSLVGTILSAGGLFLLTGLAASPWLFLLYPLLLASLLLSLGILALALLRRFP